jgi:UDP-glucose 4-epimerase
MFFQTPPMSNIWITGAAGFIGSHLTARFAGMSRPVCGLDYLAQPAGADEDKAADWQAGPIDFASLDALVSRQGVPAVVYHLAGGGSVGASFADPYQDFISSVGGTAILLEWMRINAPDARLIYVSSAAVYGDGHAGRIAEGDVKKPYSPYGAHKFASEQLCLSAAENFGLSLTIVRPFSIYGEGLRKQLLWDCCGRLAQNPARLDLGGTGGEKRDWLHVTDLCAILEHAGDASGPSPLVINAAGGSSISVREVIEALCAAWDPSCAAKIDFSGKSRAGDPFSLIANVDALKPWRFTPSVPFEEGITRYVSWYKSL